MRRGVVVVSLLSLSALGAAGEVLRVRPASADGAPSTAPLFYTGVLEENGQAVTGARNIHLFLWDDPSSAEEHDRICATYPPSTMVDAGHFRVALSDACADAVRAHTNVWIEVTVAGQSLGRTKVGAVPYALEAVRASSAAGALAERLVPAGLIAMFAGACPEGWVEYQAMRGRFPRGEPTGGSGALDQGGSDDEVVVAHSHPIGGLTGGVGDHSHGYGGNTSTAGYHSHRQYVTANNGACPGSSTLRNDYNGESSGACGYDQGWDTGGAGAHEHSYSGTTAGAGGHAHSLPASTGDAGVNGNGRNLPRFQEVIFCTKR